MKFFHNQTGALIVKEFLQMLLDRNSGKLSVQNICRRCFISRRTFYNYFDTIQHLEEKAVDFLFLSNDDEGEIYPFSNFSELLTNPQHRSAYINQILLTTSLQPYVHSQLAKAITTISSHTSEKNISPLLCSGLAHTLLDWSQRYTHHTIQQMETLCTVFLTISDSGIL